MVGGKGEREGRWECKLTSFTIAIGTPKNASLVFLLNPPSLSCPAVLSSTSSPTLYGGSNLSIVYSLPRSLPWLHLMLNLFILNPSKLDSPGV